MEPEIFKAASEAYKTGGIGYMAVVLGAGALWWFLKGLLAEMRALRDEQNDMSSLLLAQLLGKQLESEEVAKAILERVQKSLEERRRK